jgi:hypothetical protein
MRSYQSPRRGANTRMTAFGGQPEWPRGGEREQATPRAADSSSSASRFPPADDIVGV